MPITAPLRARAQHPAPLPSARLVSTNLQRADGAWIRLCPHWGMTGMRAAWTTSEPRLHARARP